MLKWSGNNRYLLLASDLRYVCCCCSVIQSCSTLCNPMDCSPPGFPVHHQLLKFAQTHVVWVNDAIQPSHPPSSLLLLPSIFPSVRVFCNESVFSISQNIWYKFLQITFIKLVIIKLVSFSTVLIFLKNFVVNGCWILFNIFPSSTEKIVCFS